MVIPTCNHGFLVYFGSISRECGDAMVCVLARSMHLNQKY